MQRFRNLNLSSIRHFLQRAIRLILTSQNGNTSWIQNSLVLQTLMKIPAKRLKQNILKISKPELKDFRQEPAISTQRLPLRLNRQRMTCRIPSKKSRNSSTSSRATQTLLSLPFLRMQKKNLQMKLSTARPLYNRNSQKLRMKCFLTLKLSKKNLKAARKQVPLLLKLHFLISIPGSSRSALSSKLQTESLQKISLSSKTAQRLTLKI